MTDPGDQRTAADGGRGRLRASRADREQAIELLKAAFVQDRLDKDELDARVGQALASRTYAELAAVSADIPAALAAAPPSAARPARRRVRSSQYKGYKAAAGAFAALSACLLAGLEIASSDGNPVEALVGWAVFTAFCALMLGALLLLHSWLDKHAAGPLPRGQGPGAPGLKGQRPGQLGPAGALPETCLDRTSTDPRTQASWPGRRPSSRRSDQAQLGMRPVPDAV
jgi:Domain of unknown function (DUF1707)